MRKAIRQAPFTPRATALVLRKLGEMKLAGEDIAAVLNQSTMNGWRGVFPVRGDHAKGKGNYSKTTGAIHNSRANIDRYREGADIVIE
jgi:hypothetical protein